jgi:hypothetical protein
MKDWRDQWPDDQGMRVRAEFAKDPELESLYESQFPEPTMECRGCGKAPHEGPCDTWATWVLVAAVVVIGAFVIVMAVAPLFLGGR